MHFGITLKPDMTPARAVALARQAEQARFGYGWLFDSHVLWLDPYPLLTMIALNTERMRLGTCVTNPAPVMLAPGARTKLPAKSRVAPAATDIAPVLLPGAPMRSVF